MVQVGNCWTMAWPGPAAVYNTNMCYAMNNLSVTLMRKVPDLAQNFVQSYLNEIN